jgi:homoserine dehydrogenase
VHLNVGLLGLGTVGSQVATRLLGRREEMAARTGGIGLNLRRVLVRQPDRDRPVPEELLTYRAEDVLDAPDIQIVVEVMGGEEPARSYLERAIGSGKHVVTANKLVMARHGPELLELAGERDVDVYFEAAVGGGIPLISTFKVDLQANEIERIQAVINGTTNYVLDRMAAGLEFSEALREAQAAGYAEADPTDDVAGFDAAYKLSILASIAFRARVHPDAVHREGIVGVDPLDFRYAAELGYVVKLLATAARDAHGRVEARVHPALLPAHHPLGRVEGAFNAVHITGDLVGEVLLWGAGAGGRPTASAVIGDLMDAVHSIRQGAFNRAPVSFDPATTLLPMDEVETKAYYRLRALDRPGVLAAVGRVFAEEDVSIASMIQKDSLEEGTAELVFTTHPAREAGLQAARRRIAELEQVRQVGAFFRVV